MRKDVLKFLFIGNQDEKEQFFKKAQEAGIVHFIDTAGAGIAKDVPEDVQHITAAIKVLRGLPTVEQEENYAPLDADAIASEILRLHHDHQKLLEDLRVLNLDISRIEIFGDFAKDDLIYVEKEGKRVIQFFYSKPDLFKDQPEPEELLYVGTDHNLDYYVAINPAPVAYDKMIEIKIEQPLGVLKHRYKEAEKKNREIERHLHEYAKYNNFLHAALLKKLNQYHLYTAQNYAKYALDDSVFAIEGWVPETKIDQLNRLVDRMHVYSEEIAIEPMDQVPTYLENTGFSRIGEDLVHIYDIPSPADKDPSLWVLICFTLFFAFIMADAGYGLVYLGIATFIRYRYPHLKGTAKRVLNLFTILSVGCIFWGILTSSFFGMDIDPNNPVRKLSIVNWLAEKKASYLMSTHDTSYQAYIQKYPSLAQVTDPHEFISYSPEGGGHPILSRLNDNVMFELALLIGVVHLMISLLRYSTRHWQNLGWVVFLIGAYLYFPYYLKVPSILNYAGGIDLVQGGKFGLQLMTGGIIFAWVGSIIINGWSGLFEVATLIQVFADTLSYLRLYALGLAGAIVASTINDIVSRVPLIVGILLIILSHGINIALSTMSGIIHGLRLNFLEWYHYSFEGGGKPFSPLKLLKKE